jgi:hypothetical protein
MKKEICHDRVTFRPSGMARARPGESISTRYTPGLQPVPAVQVSELNIVGLAAVTHPVTSPLSGSGRPRPTPPSSQYRVLHDRALPSGKVTANENLGTVSKE